MSEQPTLPAEAKITYNDFIKVHLRVGKILDASNHPNADKLIVLKVDMGTEVRQLCAGLRAHYDPAYLVGKNIVVAANLAPRQMRGVESNGMLLAASTAGHEKVIILTTDADVPPGSVVS
ncbi:MAG TPA: methionine--tRNA ligase subunit beta [Phycisphaerae bacterium]|nr:methionine--tRNA ligase subunit beta [Phycisphaerae bacterium]